ncbi:MAG: alpha/beta hydrolase fold domain-containing protein [candidate division Zixibacteria bacterium]|nr:alpha/beta hydrolase fold domain-containing protein [candidate division Zixibacteria bacterium]
MKSRITRLLAAVLLIAVLSAGSLTAQGTGPEREVTLTAPDGLVLHGWLSGRPSEGPVPLIVALPMRGRTHTSYDQLTVELVGRCRRDSLALPYLLKLDLRGHGKSVAGDSILVDYRDMSNDEYCKIPGDVAEMIRLVLADETLKIDTSRIAVVGASIGANSAVMVTEHFAPIHRVVMLSPGADYRGLAPSPALEKYAGKVLIYAGQQDQYSYQSSTALAAMDPERISLKVFGNGDHGTTIINNDKDAMTYMLDWIFGGW